MKGKPEDVPSSIGRSRVLVEGMMAEFWGSLQEERHNCWVLASGPEIAKLFTLTIELSLDWATDGITLT